MEYKESLSFDAEDKTIEEILFKTMRKYRIPRYQRPYAWSGDEIQDFWNDLIGNVGEYFLGSLIFNYETVEKDNIIEIIDGQQRLLTITLFMSVLRDICREIGEDSYADKIQKECIAFESIRGDQSVRIICGDSTREFFEKYVQKDKEAILSTKNLNKEWTVIKDNYIFFKEKLMHKINKSSDKASQLDCIKDFYEKVAYLRVIWIKIEDEADAYTIFETVNARGLDLNVADLLKNAIFKEVKNDSGVDIAKKIWLELVTTIEEAVWEVSKFIRYYWLSKYGHISEKRLFKAIKNTIKDYKKFLHELNNSAKVFSLITSGNEEDFYDIKEGAQIYKALKAIRVMRVSQCFVLFMAIIRNLDKIPMKIARLFTLIEKFTFNYLTICNMPSNRIEKIYSKYAIKLENVIDTPMKKNLLKNIQSIFDNLQNELKELRPPFQIFEENFREVYYKNSEPGRLLLRYILSSLNSVYDTGEMLPDFTVVNIEHILPRKPDKAWGVNKREISSYVNKLGNLTLLKKEINRSIGNKPPKFKIKGLEKSKIAITEELVKEIKRSKYKWNESSINKRQKCFADLAYNKVWNF